ncbi:hypothetical protein [Kitasatospora sp. MAA4]|uniref:hypothetical protein n=1 Tax=Kitasatospora sp. MAA4 TaxID=3035093 RepID=UPI00247386AA|nr:hypothetical protein [Kitasatospora sp. MAA4]
MPPARRWKIRSPDAQAHADAAETEIRALRKAVDDAEEALKTARSALAQSIARHVQSDVVTQAEAGRASGYDTRHVNRLIREAGVPPKRGADT